MTRLLWLCRGCFSKNTLVKLRLRPRLIIALVLFWLALVLSNYYTQLWYPLLKGNWLQALRTIEGGGVLHLDVTNLPYFEEALARTVRGVAGAGLLLTSAVFLGLMISRALRWRYVNWRERLPFAAAIGIGGFSYTGLGLAAIGLYQAEVLRVLVAIPLLGGIGWWLVRKKGPFRWHAVFPSVIRPRVAWLWVACTLLAVSFAGIAALAPEREYDALWYHLTYPKLALDWGWLVDNPTDYVSLYPMTWELWFGFGLALGGQTTATLLHFACLPLTAMVSYELARRFVPGTSPWLAVALFATVPTVMWEASTAYIDLALTLHVTLLIYGLLRYTERGKWQWLLLSALNLGLALATKHSALFVLGLVCTGLAIYLWQAGRTPWQSLWPVLLLAGLSLLFPMPWYLRSLLAAENPTFPFLYQLFGAPPDRWDAVTQQGLQRFLDHFGRPRTFLNQVTLPWHMTIHAAAYGGTLGPLFLILIPALVFRRWKRALPWLFAFAALYIAFWASPISSFQMRFLVPITPVLAILAANSFTRLAALVRIATGRYGATVLAGGFALLMVLNLPPFTPFHEKDRVGWEGWLNHTLHGVPLGVVIGAQARETYLRQTVRSYGVWSFVNRTLPEDARILTWSGGDQFYTRHDRIWAMSTAARYVAWAPAGEESQVLRGLHKLGITHLIVDCSSEDSLDEWGQYAITGPVARASWYDVLYEDRYYVLYRLRWEQLTSQLAGVNP